MKRNLSLRLALWYTAVFFFSALVLFAFAYHSLSSSLKNEDRKTIELKFREYLRAFQEDGLLGVEMRINGERDAGKPVLFFVRIAGPDNKTLLLSLPDQWTGLDPTQIGGPTIGESSQQIRVKTGEAETVFEIVSFPLAENNVLQIGKDIQAREELLMRFRHVFAGVMIPAILVGLMGGGLVTFRALQPVRHLTQTVRSVVDTGSVETRVPTGKTDDELSELVLLVNRMLERIESLIRGMQESLDSVAHELRTPLARLRSIAENALEADQNLETCREALSDCLEEAERIVKMLNILMDISEARTGVLRLDRKPVDVSALLEELVELYGYVAEERHIHLQTDFVRGLMINADPQRMRQALGNLLDNAVKYTPVGGRVAVSAKHEEGRVMVTVQDTGIGIPPEELTKIWDRLYRGGEGRRYQGLGLGLSFVKSIIEVHGGHVDVISRPGSGSTFIVELPAFLP
ncbi:MAG: ATP-binding protein [Syntrophales bacterium]|nr:ATP-binding protein [Syntrophales bacterium]